MKFNFSAVVCGLWVASAFVLGTANAEGEQPSVLLLEDNVTVTTQEALNVYRTLEPKAKRIEIQKLAALVGHKFRVTIGLGRLYDSEALYDIVSEWYGEGGTKERSLIYFHQLNRLESALSEIEANITARNLYCPEPIRIRLFSNLTTTALDYDGKLLRVDNFGFSIRQGQTGYWFAKKEDTENVPTDARENRYFGVPKSALDTFWGEGNYYVSLVPTRPLRDALLEVTAEMNNCIFEYQRKKN